MEDANPRIRHFDLEEEKKWCNSIEDMIAERRKM